MAHIPPTLQNGVDLSSQDQSTSCDASLSSTNSASAWMQRIYGNAFMQERLGMAQDPIEAETNQDMAPFEPGDISYDEVGDDEPRWCRDSEDVSVATQEVLDIFSEEEIKDVRQAFPDASPETSIAILVQEKLARDESDDLHDEQLQEVLNSDDTDFWKLFNYNFISLKDEDDISFGLPQMKPDRALELLDDPVVGDELKGLVGLPKDDELDSGDGKLKLLESLLQPENALAFVSANNQYTHNAWERDAQGCEKPVDLSQEILAGLYSIGTATEERGIHCHPGPNERGGMIQGLADQIN